VSSLRRNASDLKSTASSAVVCEEVLEKIAATDSGSTDSSMSEKIFDLTVSLSVATSQMRSHPVSWA